MNPDYLVNLILQPFAIMEEIKWTSPKVSSFGTGPRLHEVSTCNINPVIWDILFGSASQPGNSLQKKPIRDFQAAASNVGTT